MSFLFAALASCGRGESTAAPGGGSATPAAPSVVAPTSGLLAKPLADDPLAVTVHALSNGMRVYISPDHTKPLVDARIVVRAGHRHESDDATGLAHYLEHMLFKGTDKLGTRDYEAERPHLEAIARLYDELASAKGDEARASIIAKIDSHTQAAAAYASPNEVSTVLAAIGAGNVNASTGKDSTRYTVDSLPINRFETWAELEAERFRNPIFRLFLPELESVYEEKNRALDNAFRKTFKAIEAMAFGEHPYARPSLGTAEHLRTPAYGEMVRFYERWYVPGNMDIVLVGDVEPATALPILERTLGSLPVADVPAQPHAVASPAKAMKTVVRGDDAAVSLVWPTVPTAHPDAVALGVMSRIFSDGDNGLLEQHLVRTHKVTGASASPVHYREAGLWSVRAAVRPDQTHDAVAADLQSVVDRLKAGEFTDEAVAAARLQFELGDKWMLESRSGRAYALVDSIESGATWSESVARRNAYAKVSREDIIAVARAHLSGNPRIVELQRGDPDVPKLKSPKITPLKLDTTHQSGFARELLGRKVEPLSPAFAEEGRDFSARALPGGRFVAVPNEVSDLVTVTYSFDVGERDDALLCPSIDALQSGGSAKRTASELQAELGRLGAQSWFYCGVESSGFGFVTLDRNLEATAALMHEWMRELVVEDSVVAAMTHAAIEERKDDYGSARTLAAALSAWALQADQSPYRIVATNRELATLTGKGAAERTKKLLRYPHRTAYYGPRAADDAAAALALPAPELALPSHDPRRYVKRDEATVFLIDKKLAKSDVRVVHPLPSLYDSRDPISYVFDAYYDGGMDSLMFQELREARALAYSVWEWSENPSRPGDELRLQFGLQTAADKTTSAARALIELAERPIDTERFERVKTGEMRAMRRWRWEPRNLGGRVEEWEQMELSADPRRDRWTRIQALSQSDVEAFRVRVTGGAPVITIVGERAAMNEADLEALGKVVVVEPASLFNYE